MIHPGCEACGKRSNLERRERLNVSIIHSGRMSQWGQFKMRRHCLVTLGNRCAAAEAPVQPHKVCIFGMSNEQVLCIIHLCSIFHVQEQESGFWSLLGGPF